MKVPDNNLIKLARMEFLGRGPVVGIGLSERKVTFLLAEESAETQADIERWAKAHGVQVCFKTSGKNIPLFK